MVEYFCVDATGGRFVREHHVQPIRGEFDQHIRYFGFPTGNLYRVLQSKNRLDDPVSN
jgi:hypothetical protein